MRWNRNNEVACVFVYLTVFEYVFVVPLDWYNYNYRGLVWFYGISTIVGYLMPNPPNLYIYIKYIWFGLVGFYGISTIVGYLMSNPLYTYILNIYDLVWFYGISTIVVYLMPNPLYTYILKLYDLVWFGFMAYQPL